MLRFEYLASSCCISYASLNRNRLRTTSRTRKSQVSVFFSGVSSFLKYPANCKQPSEQPTGAHTDSTQEAVRRAVARATKCRSAFLVPSTNSQPRWFASLVSISSFEFQGSRLEALYTTLTKCCTPTLFDDGCGGINNCSIRTSVHRGRENAGTKCFLIYAPPHTQGIVNSCSVTQHGRWRTTCPPRASERARARIEHGSSFTQLK